jgi:hypothetical protein
MKRQIQIKKRKDLSDIKKEKQIDSTPLKTPKITLKTWLSESLGNINKQKQLEASAFFN